MKKPSRDFCASVLEFSAERVAHPGNLVYGAVPNASGTEFEVRRVTSGHLPWVFSQVFSNFVIKVSVALGRE